MKDVIKYDYFDIPNANFRHTWIFIFAYLVNLKLMSFGSRHTPLMTCKPLVLENPHHHNLCCENSFVACRTRAIIFDINSRSVMPAQNTKPTIAAHAVTCSTRGLGG